MDKGKEEAIRVRLRLAEDILRNDEGMAGDALEAEMDRLEASLKRRYARGGTA